MLNKTCKNSKEVFIMEQENLVDIMYEVLLEKIKIPTELKENSLRNYTIIERKLKEVIGNKEKVVEILEDLDEYIDSLNTECEFKNKVYYKNGLYHYEELKKELKSIDIIEKNEIAENLLNKIYEYDVENIALLTEKDKKICNEKVKEIIFSNISENLKTEEIDKIKTQIDEYVNNIYLECSYLCEKNYKFGIKRCFEFILEYLKNT